MVAVKYADLLDVFELVSFGAPFDSSAFICADTGVIHCTSDTLELDEEVPEDLETSDRYIAIPHKNDLHLGRDLVLSFVDQALPEDYGTVAGFFRRKGAYSLQAVAGVPWRPGSLVHVRSQCRRSRTAPMV